MTVIVCSKCKKQIWPNGEMSGEIHFANDSPVCLSCLVLKPRTRRIRWEVLVWDFMWVIGTWFAVFELNRSPWWWALCIFATASSWYKKEV